MSNHTHRAIRDIKTYSDDIKIYTDGFAIEVVHKDV